MPDKIPTFTGPIAIIDMLGFQDYVTSNDINYIIDEYAHLITGASLSNEIFKNDLEFMVYSDTIAIRLINISENGFYNFIRALQQIIHSYFYKLLSPTHESLPQPLPIRGSLGFGEYAWHKGDISTHGNGCILNAKNINFILGEPIIDAHNHEEQQEWISISAPNDTVQKLLEHFPQSINRLISERYLIDYQIPTKNGPISGLTVIPVERAFFARQFDEFLEKTKQISNANNNKITIKYLNTLKFLYFIGKNNYIPPYNSKIPPLCRNIEFNEKKYKEIVNKIDL